MQDPNMQTLNMLQSKNTTIKNKIANIYVCKIQTCKKLSMQIS